MTQHRTYLLSCAAALALASCSTTQAQQPRTDACPIASSANWKAWVNAMPGPGASPKLIAEGQVTAPTGDYTFAWRDLRVMESNPVQAVAELEALPPDGPATQALETHDLRGEWPIDPPVGSLTINCGNRTLARISPVETAH